MIEDMDSKRRRCVDIGGNEGLVRANDRVG